MHHWPIRPQQMSQSGGDNRSNSHVHFCIGNRKQQMSQTQGDISSKSHAHFCIGIQLFRICNTYYIFIGEYCISSDRSPWLELETWLVFETQLLLEEIRYTILNILNAGIPMRKCIWLLLLLLPHDCDIFWHWCGPCGTDWWRYNANRQGQMITSHWQFDWN